MNKIIRYQFTSVLFIAAFLFAVHAGVFGTEANVSQPDNYERLLQIAILEKEEQIRLAKELGITILTTKGALEETYISVFRGSTEPIIIKWINISIN